MRDAQSSSRGAPLIVIIAAALALWLPTPTLASAAGQTLPNPEPVPPDPAADPFFSDELLQDVRLTINPRDWQELRDNYLTNRYYPCYFTWNGITVRNVGIRSRGTGSRSGTKPGLRVDFDHYTDKQRFLNLRSVVLRNQTQDPSMLHESVAMKLLARLGIPSPREAHARLYINGEYAGLYTIVEAVDKVFLKRHYQQDDGYLYEYDYNIDDEPWRFEYRGSDPALYSPKPFKPVTHEKDPDPKPIEAFIRTIDGNRGGTFASRIAAYIDMRQFLAYVAAENFLGELDGILGDYGVNNFYFYRFEQQTRSTIIPWDKSEAFTGRIDHPVWHNIDVVSWLRNRLMERAMELPDFIDAYLDGLAKAAGVAAEIVPPSDPVPASVSAAPTGPGWLESEVLRQYRLIRDAALADPAKPFSNDEFEQGVAALIEFARGRSSFVTSAVERARAGR